MNASDYYAQKLPMASGAHGLLDNPTRLHEADGIGECRSEQTEETYNLALDFLADIASPEGYGHAVSPEVVKRAVRILSTLRPRGYVAPREDQE